MTRNQQRYTKAIDMLRGETVIGIDDVAWCLGRSARWFRENRASFEAQGFPKPLPGSHNRWACAQLMTWLGYGVVAHEESHPEQVAEGLITPDVITRRASELVRAG